MKEKLAKGLMWLSAAKVIVNFLTFVSTLILARLLTPEDFGLVALATTMITIISSVTDLSLSSALIHHKEPSDHLFSTAWTLNFGRALILALAFCATAPFLAEWYKEPRLLPIMLALAASIAISGLNNPKLASLTKSLIFWQEFALMVSQKFIAFVVGVVVAYIYETYWALIAATLAAQLASLILSYLVLPFRPKFSVQGARSLWSFSIWLTLGKILNTLNFRLDHLLVGTYVGRPALGLYTVGDQIAAMPTREIISPIESTLFPGFARISDDPARLRNAYRAAQTLLTTIALPLGFGIALLAEPIVRVAMGEKWLAAATVIQALAPVFAIQTMYSAVLPLAMARGETRILFFRDLLTFGVRVPLVVGGMILGGLTGIIYGRILANVVGIFVNMNFVKRMVGISLFSQVTANWRSLSSTAFMVLAVLMLQRSLPQSDSHSQIALQIALCMVTGGATYVGSTVVLWLANGKKAGPEREIIDMVLRLRAKLKASKKSPGA